MSYQTAITIKDAINNIRKRKYVLPSIQREFVWHPEQIEMLFDSLMRDYPISTFLFWQVDKDRVGAFQFYEFLKDYHEKKNRHNAKADLATDEDVIALLDGQQRLTSLYVALCGSYAKKKPYHHWSNDKAFPPKYLYLYLLEPSDEMETEFRFKFLTKAEAKTDKGWFRCSKILKFEDLSSVQMYLMEKGLTDTSKYSKKQSKFAITTLSEFFNVIHQKGTISYFLEKSPELDKVLQIFIRINSGGTVLSYSDLLLSIATAQWTERDAREVIHEFVDDINAIGDGFDFSKDNVLKACLVLADLDVKFKVDNFTKGNMKKIESNWDGISGALKSAVRLVSKLGYRRDNLTATNAIIPIAYFIYINEFEDSILHNSEREDDRKSIREWLARVLLKGTFGGQPDSLYPKMRELMNKHEGRFPLKEIIANYSGQRKSISFSEEDIENLLDLEYGKRGTYSALTLLYPGLNYTFNYHQDHIHPKSAFHKTRLRKAGFSEEDIENFKGWFNTLSNLQLMQETENIQKSAKPFETWINSQYPTEVGRNAYLQQHYISTEASLDLKDFEAFYGERWEALKQKFIEILGATVTTEELEA